MQYNVQIPDRNNIYALEEGRLSGKAKRMNQVSLFMQLFSYVYSYLWMAEYVAFYMCIQSQF